MQFTAGAAPTVEIRNIRVDADGNAWGEHVLDGKSVIQPGKYRALFFLVPVKR
jgi:hypothetical protein